MNRDEYVAYLESDHWKATRARIMKRAGYEFGPPDWLEKQATCEQCGNRSGKVVHHLTYEHIGEERDDELVFICRWCHRKHHPSMPLRER